MGGQCERRKCRADVIVVRLRVVLVGGGMLAVIVLLLLLLLLGVVVLLLNVHADAWRRRCGRR